jgi:4'-phosphopantetheinyl transferase EntD
MLLKGSINTFAAGRQFLTSPTLAFSAQKSNYCAMPQFKACCTFICDMSLANGSIESWHVVHNYKK